MDGREQVDYDATMNPHPLSTQTRPVTATDLGATPDSLAGLCMEFPAFRIWREIIGDRIQYVARRRNAHTHPHTMVTADPARLRSVLSAGLTRSNHAPDDPAASS
jgi:hypothetical protein